MIWSLIGAGAFVAAAVAVFLILGTQREKPIKIGAIISLSGPAGHLVAVRDGMQLAVDEVNVWGGVNGRKIELIVEDSKSSKEEGKKAFERIEARDHPLLYVSVTSSGSMAVAPLAEKNKAVLVGLTALTHHLTKQKAWVFRYYTSRETEVKPILDILRHLKVKKLGVLYQDDEFGVSVYELLKESFVKSGGSVVAVPFAVRNPDFKSRISKLKDTEAIYVAGFVKNEGKAIRQLKKERYPGFILGHSGVTNLVGKIPETEGVYVASPLMYNPDFVFAREVKDKYETRYGRPFTHQAANGYDFIKLVAALMEDGEVSRESIRRHLEGGFIHPGIFGELDIKPGNHDISIPLHPARIEKGKIKFLNLY